MKCENGITYEGEFVKGKFEGFGIDFWKMNKYFEGV